MEEGFYNCVAGNRAEVLREEWTRPLSCFLRGVVCGMVTDMAILSVLLKSQSVFATCKGHRFMETEAQRPFQSPVFGDPFILSTFVTLIGREKKGSLLPFTKFQFCIKKLPPHLIYVVSLPTFTWCISHINSSFLVIREIVVTPGGH